MSSKKDKFSSSDKYYMNLAINLASNQKGLTGTNPPVGCVIVKNKKIISYGATSTNGRPHAEIVALNKNKKEIIGATVYLTLEPCSHYGKTPPCTNALIKSKIYKVIYSIEDSDLRSFNKAKKILTTKKIQTKSGLLSKKVKKLYGSYIYVRKNKFPYVIGKIACSSNYYILKKKTSITNEHSKKTSHLLRYQNQGILTSHTTINNDNPKLTCRINGLKNFSPTKIILDRDLKININSYVIKHKTKLNTIIFHNSKKNKKISFLKKKGAKLIFFNVESDNYFDLKKILKKIHSLGIHSLLIECGKKLTTKFLSNNLINEFYLFKSSKIIKNKGKINVLNIKEKLNRNFRHKNFVNTYLDKDTLMHYY